MLRRIGWLGLALMTVGIAGFYVGASHDLAVWPIVGLGVFVLGLIIQTATASTWLITAMAPKDTKDKT